MPRTAADQFTNSHVVLEDGAVAFRCASDIEQWPWLELDPFDPIVVQSINYYAASEASHVRGTIDPKSWTALTQTEWTCGEKNAGHTTHGIAEAFGKDGKPGYTMTFFDAEGGLVYRMSGTGVVFQNRDFEAWRKSEKQKIATSSETQDFQYAPPDAVGAAKQSESFLSSLIEDDTRSALALITKENGFLPAHPYLSGSGDHVNSTHLADVARQFVNLLRGGEAQSFIGGEMNFSRYVELEYPFRIVLTADLRLEKAISMAIHQAEHSCATIMMRYESR